MDKPIHVQVAEALGWAGLKPTRSGAQWWGVSPVYPISLLRVPDYSSDWSATGPLVEKYKIALEWHHLWSPPGWCAVSEDGEEVGLSDSTLLLAICHLIIALGKAGKL